MKTPKEVRERFPYMWRGDDLGIFVAKGWMQIFAQVCTDIDALLGEDKRGFRWLQIKEKFGAPRFYCRMDPVKPPPPPEEEEWSDDELPWDQWAGETEAQRNQRLAIFHLVGEVQLAAIRICIVCGNPCGPGRSGILLSLCSEHREQYKAKSMESPWFKDEEE